MKLEKEQLEEAMYEVGNLNRSERLIANEIDNINKSLYHLVAALLPIDDNGDFTEEMTIELEEPIQWVLCDDEEEGWTTKTLTKFGITDRPNLSLCVALYDDNDDWWDLTEEDPNLSFALKDRIIEQFELGK